VSASSDARRQSHVHSRTGSIARPPFDRIADWAIPVALGLLFLSVSYQPRASLGPLDVSLGDVAVLAAVLAAIEVARRNGSSALRAALPIWITAALLLLWIVAASLYPTIWDGHYRWGKHLVSALKVAEYASLAPAAAILLRSDRALSRLFVGVAVTATAGAVVCALQFVGVDIFGAWAAWGRQPSFSGVPELAALGGTALAVGFYGLLWPGAVGRRTLAAVLVAGTVDLILGAAVAGGIALGAAAVAAAAVAVGRSDVARRRTLRVAAVTAVCAAGVLWIRSGDITQFGRYVGLAQPTPETTQQVQTYAQRSLMAYIGLRVWREHPVLGAGWQAIREPQVYTPELAAAHARFPDQPPRAFPSPAHPWGIDNGYIEALAELGAVGLVLFLAPLATGLVLGTRSALRAPPAVSARATLGVLWLLIAIGSWIGQGLSAGTPWAAVAWLGLGLVAAARAGASSA
jgi:hypothetical protein